MATQLRKWFFDTPKASTYDRFSKNNKPSEATYRSLFDSVTFKLETDDTAAEGSQGLVKLATDANVKLRTSASSGMQTVVRPHQLPMMQLGDATEATIALGAQTYGGLKLTALSKTATGGTRLNYQVEFDPDNLSAKGSPVNADYFVIVDSADDLPKKVLVSNISSLLEPYWTIDGTEVTPILSTYTLKFPADVYFATGAARALYVETDDAGAGDNLSIHAGGGYGGGANDGGDLLLYGGIAGGGGVSGDTLIAWSGSTLIGKVGIGGAVDSTYFVKVYGGVWATGKCKVGTTGTGAITHAAMLNTDGELLIKTGKEFMDHVVGSTLAADAVPYFDGAAWTSEANVGAKLQYIAGLTSDAQTQIDTKITAGAAAIVNADVHASAAIATSKLAAATVIGYLSGLDENIMTKINNLQYKAGGGGIAYKTIDFTADETEASNYSCNITSGNIAVDLPDTATIEDGLKFTFIIKYSSGTNTLTLSVTGGGDAIINNDLAETTTYVMTAGVGSLTGSSVTIIKKTDGYWEVIQEILIT